MEDKVFKLLKDNDAAKVCSILNISLYELFTIVDKLKTKQVYLYPKINSQGNLFFNEKKLIGDEDTKLTVKDDKYVFLVISDIHIGSKYDDVNRLEIIKNFALNNEINLILNCGDLIDGPVHEDQSMPKRIESLDDQINEFMEKYPLEHGLNTICVLGDHDLKYKTENNDSINKSIKKYRPDIRVYSSGCGIININGKEILICHNSSDNRIKQRLLDDMYMFAGHSHMYLNKTYYNGIDYSLRIVAPSISNLPLYNHVMPGFLKVSMYFNDYDLTKINIDNYNFSINNEILFNGSINYNLNVNNNMSRKRNK